MGDLFSKDKHKECTNVSHVANVTVCENDGEELICDGCMAMFGDLKVCRECKCILNLKLESSTSQCEENKSVTPKAGFRKTSHLEVDAKGMLDGWNSLYVNMNKQDRKKARKVMKNL